MNNTTNKEEYFSEAEQDRAYQELLFIFRFAIESQNFNRLEEQIAAWENRYPLSKFTNPEIIRKIKAILNKDFLNRLVGDYLASQILHEKEKQKTAYEDLKKIIDNAKKSKDYKTAQNQINKWKSTLTEKDLSVVSFDRYYKSKIFTLLLIPTREIAKQEEAFAEITHLNEKKLSMDSENYTSELVAWQNKYPLQNFPEKLQKDLNTLTLEAKNSISKKREAEFAIKELHELFNNNNPSATPLDCITSIMSKYDYNTFENEAKAQIENMISKYLSLPLLPEVSFNTSEPTIYEFDALNNLKVILDKNPHNMDTILNWIYTNRNTNFSQYVRDEIIKYFSSIGYTIPVQESYHIPTINMALPYADFDSINNIQKDVILNYLGILSQGNALSDIGAQNLGNIQSVSKKLEVPNPPIEITVFNNTPTDSNSDLINPINSSHEEHSDIYIEIENLLTDPSDTYPLSPHTQNKIPQPEIFEEFSSESQANVFEEPSSEPQANVFEESNSETQANVFEESNSEPQVEIQKETSSAVLEETVPNITTSIPNNSISENNTTYPQSIKLSSVEIDEQANPLDNVSDNFSNLEDIYNLSAYVSVASSILKSIPPKEGHEVVLHPERQRI